MTSFIYGKKVFQPIFKKLFSLSLKGLNYGIVGSGEKWVMKYVHSKLNKPNPVVFDVGANVGLYTRDVVEVFGNQSKIHSFEPVQPVFERLRENLADTSAILLPYGLGSKKESIEIKFSEQQHTFSSIFERDNLADNYVKTLIEIDTIDNHCDTYKINEIDFLKIDTEGNEYNCLIGAENMLSRQSIKYIQFEFGGSTINAKRYFKDFFELLNGHYKISRILNNGLEEVKSYSERHEVFYYSNYLAELRTL